MILPVLHVGFHKSGSTTLQNALFSRHSAIANIGEPDEHPGALAAVRNAWESCYRDPAQQKPFDLEGSRSLWQQAIKAVDKNKIVLFSKERLTFYDYCNDPGDRCLPQKLRAIVGPARIVIMTRHQIKLVESLYYSKTGGEVTPEQWLKVQTDGPLNADRFRVYRYNGFAEAYAEAFGQENVGVFMLEELAKDPASFASRLSGFIGIDAEETLQLLQRQQFHSRKTTRGVAYAKLRGILGRNVHFGNYVPAKVTEAFIKFLGRGKPLRVVLPADWVSELTSFYRDDNRRLAKDWRLPLDKYGYPL